MLQNSKNQPIFVSVFHRILDFKAGLDFYLGPFFYAHTQQAALCIYRKPAIPQRLSHRNKPVLVGLELSFCLKK